MGGSGSSRIEMLEKLWEKPTRYNFIYLLVERLLTRFNCFSDGIEFGQDRVFWLFFFVIVFREAIEYPASFRKTVFICMSDECSHCYLQLEWWSSLSIWVFTKKKWKSSLRVHMCLLWLLESKLIFLMTFLYLTIRKISLKIHYHIFFQPSIVPQFSVP